MVGKVIVCGLPYEWHVCITCGGVYTVPETLIAQHRAKGGYHTCYNGHSQGWSKEDSEEAKIRRERDRLKQQIAQKDDEIAAAWRTANQQLEQKRAVEKKLKAAAKRASAGTCPCCNRTVSQMARHMRSKHPTFIAEAAE